MDSEYFWLALSNVPGVGNVMYSRLLETFGTPEGVFRAAEAELKAVEGIRRNTVDAVTSFVHDTQAQKEVEKIRRSGSTFLTLRDRRYPALLWVDYRHLEVTVRTALAVSLHLGLNPS